LNRQFNWVFSPSEAEFLVNQTFAGSVQLQKRSKIGNEEWIEKVASKGGTTEAALEVFSNWNMKSIIDTALKAANERAIALGKKIKSTDFSMLLTFHSNFKNIIIDLEVLHCQVHV
jgi:hypothetical protein